MTWCADTWCDDRGPVVSHCHLQAQWRQVRGPVAAGPPPHSSCRAQGERSPLRLPHRGSGAQRQQGLRAGKLNFCTI